MKDSVVGNTVNFHVYYKFKRKPASCSPPGITVLSFVNLSYFLYVCISISVAECVYSNLYPCPGLRPRRTLRTVLWTAEEQGGVEAQQYYNLHKVLSTVTANRRHAATSVKLKQLKCRIT